MVMKHTQTRRCAGFSGNLDRPGEGTVRFETTPFGGRKIATPQPGGPCRTQGKPLYQPQLMVLIRSRIESGPPGTRSFLLPERAGLKCWARFGQPSRTAVEGPAS